MTREKGAQIIPDLITHLSVVKSTINHWNRPRKNVAMTGDFPQIRIIQRGPRGCPKRLRLSKFSASGLRAISSLIDGLPPKRKDRRHIGEGQRYIRSLLRWYEWNAASHKETRRAGQRKAVRA